MSRHKPYNELLLQEKQNCSKIFNTYLKQKPDLPLTESEKELLTQLFDNRNPTLIEGIYNIIKNTILYKHVLFKQQKETRKYKFKQEV